MNESLNDFMKNSILKDVVYHGTWETFDNFDKSKRGSYGKGFYFFKNEESANSYGNIIKKCLLDVRNPFYLDEGSFNIWKEKYYSKNINDITKKLRFDGYDAVITLNEYVVFDNKQIKILN